jgi:ethanolamine utilization protein EutQ
MTTKAFKYKKQAIKDQQPSMNVPGVDAWLGDTFISADADKRICAGFFRLEKGNKLVYDYDYEEMKCIVDGTFIISDETGQKVTATAGDVFYFPSGSRITFETPDFAVGFFCGQRVPL